MENVYAGHCSERCRVLCTIELGLAFSRRLSEDEDEDEEGTVDGDGMPVARACGHEERPSAPRLVAMGGGWPRGHGAELEREQRGEWRGKGGERGERGL